MMMTHDGIDGSCDCIEIICLFMQVTVLVYIYILLSNKMKLVHDILDSVVILVDGVVCLYGY